MGTLTLPDGTILKTKEGDRYELTRTMFISINGQDEFKVRAGDEITVGKIDKQRKIIPIP